MLDQLCHLDGYWSCCAKDNIDRNKEPKDHFCFRCEIRFAMQKTQVMLFQLATIINRSSMVKGLTAKVLLSMHVVYHRITSNTAYLGKKGNRCCVFLLVVIKFNNIRCELVFGSPFSDFSVAPFDVALFNLAMFGQATVRRSCFLRYL